MDFFLKTEYSVFFVLIFIAVSFLISYYTYRNSGINNPFKFFLRILRFLSVFLILFLLITPFIKSLKILTKKPLNIILIDNSASLDIEGRNNELIKYLKENIDFYKNNESDTKIFLFSGNLSKEITINDIDSIEFQKGFETNLSLALQTISEKYMDSRIAVINIISDGIINTGGNPSNSLKFPDTEINHYLIGDTVQKKDLVLEDINFNKFSFIESITPVKVSVSSYGYNKQIKIDLFEENNLIDSRTINVNENTNRYSITFNVSSSIESIKKYKIEIEPQENEITTKNNSEEFFIKYLNNKIKTLVLSGGPGADYAYISQEIKKINNLETKLFTQKSGSEFYEGTLDKFDNYQVFILAGYPTSVSNPSIITDLKERMAKKNCCLLFIAGKAVDYTRLSIIEEYLPFSTNISSSPEITSRLSFVNNSGMEQNYFKSLNSIVNFPNIFKAAARIPVKPQTETVLVFSDNREPALILSNTSSNKSAGIMFYGIYKWRLNPNSVNSDEVLNSLISGSVLSILEKEKSNKFNIETSKQVYSPSDNVIFKAEINDRSLNSNQKIKVRIFNNNFNKIIELEKTGEFEFTGKENINNPGEYNYTAELLSNADIIEKAENKFIIGESSKEYKSTKTDGTLLNQLSNISGGVKLNSLSNTEIKDFITRKCNNLSDKTEFTEKIFLNSNLIYLVIIVFLLCLEWFLRKRNNLP